MAQITRQTLIGDIFQQKQGADVVIRRYFGNGCFTCPAIITEPLEMGSAMHGTDLDALVADLNALPDGVTEITFGPQEEERKPFFSRIFGK